MPVSRHIALGPRQTLDMVHACAVKRLTAFAAALLLIAACSSERSSSTADASGTTTVPGVETSATPTSTTPTTVAGTTTTLPCLVSGDTNAKASDEPLLMSGLVGVDIRAGSHPCYERIVIELGGTGDFPGWSVEYVDDPVRLSESEEFVEIEGDATLQVIMRSWMPSMEGDGYAGPIQIFPEGVAHILEMRETENLEGVCIWSIGLDAQYPFTAEVFTDPARLVIDLVVQRQG